MLGNDFNLQWLMLSKLQGWTVDLSCKRSVMFMSPGWNCGRKIYKGGSSCTWACKTRTNTGKSACENGLKFAHGNSARWPCKTKTAIGQESSKCPCACAFQRTLWPATCLIWGNCLYDGSICSRGRRESKWQNRSATGCSSRSESEKSSGNVTLRSGNAFEKKKD